MLGLFVYLSDPYLCIFTLYSLLIGVSIQIYFFSFDDNNQFEIKIHFKSLI